MTCTENVMLYVNCLKFINNSLKNYGLYPRYVWSSLAFCWDAMLNMKKVKPELIPDVGMYLFFEKHTKGGVLYNSKIYSKANKSISNLMIQSKNQNIYN